MFSQEDKNNIIPCYGHGKQLGGTRMMMDVLFYVFLWSSISNWGGIFYFADFYILLAEMVLYMTGALL